MLAQACGDECNAFVVTNPLISEGTAVLEGQQWCDQRVASGAFRMIMVPNLALFGVARL